MSNYGGADPNIVDGNPLASLDVQDSFDKFSVAVNAIDSSNVSSERVITYRSIEPDSLTQTFKGRQLISGEPAAWVAMGRGGTTLATRFSLGPRENVYTIDGCSVRASVNKDSRAFVHSFIQVESIKVGWYTGASSLTFDKEVVSVDMSFVFKLKQLSAGQPHSSATTLDTVTKVMKIPTGVDTTSPTFEDHQSAVARRRGFTVELSDDVTLGSVDSNGSAYDFFVTVETSFTAAKARGSGGGTNDLAIADTQYNNYLFLAHLRSYSRYTTARVFLR